MQRKFRITLFAVGALIALAVAATIPKWPLYASASDIERQLLADTPLGTLESRVIEDLKVRDRQPREPWHGKIEPGSTYPPTEVGGDGYVRATIGTYRIVFETAVEAYYIFGPDGRLVDIRVRKTTDAL